MFHVSPWESKESERAHSGPDTGPPQLKDPPTTLQEALPRISALERGISALERQLAALMSQKVVESCKNYRTHYFYLKRNIMGEWQELNKWIEVCRLQDLPPKFQRGTNVTFFFEVFRVLGYRDFITLVGTWTTMCWSCSLLNSRKRHDSLTSQRTVLFRQHYLLDLSLGKH